MFTKLYMIYNQLAYLFQQLLIAEVLRHSYNDSGFRYRRSAEVLIPSEWPESFSMWPRVDNIIILNLYGYSRNK